MRATLLLMLAAAIAAGAAKPLQVGDRLPVLKGDYLSKRKAVLPEHSKGKVALLLFGFSYQSRFPVEEFGKKFRRRFEKEPDDVTFYEIPMIGGLARLGGPFIDSGMRRGTPQTLHENVITVYGGTGPWKDLLAVKNEDHAYLVVIDRDGVIRWFYRGEFTEAALAELVEKVEAMVR